MESSQRSFSQGLDNTTDMKMVEILAGLADDQSQSRTSQSVLPDPELPSDDEQVEAEDEAHEDEDSIVMSQQVWDDTDPADPQCSGNNDKDVNDDKDDNHDNNDNDDNDENDDKKDDNNDKDDHDDNDSGDQTGCQGSQFSLYLSDASTSEEEEEEERDNSKGLQDLSSNAEKSQDNTEIQTAGQKEHTKMVLMGRAEEVLPTVEIEKLSSSGTSGTLSSNKEFVTDVNAELTPSRAIGTPSLDVELSTVTKDELSPSCTSDSERSIKELPPAATEELSPSCTSDTSLSSNNERRPVAKDELSPSVTSETFSSNKELLLNESFETDMHESNHSVRRGSSGGIFLEDERSDTTSNQVNSLEDEEVGYTFNLKRSEEVESSEYKSQLSPLTSSETIDSIHKEDQVGSANLEKSEELFRENSNEEMPVYKENTLPSNESNDIKSSEEENAAQSLDNPAIAKSSAEANLQHSSSTLKKCEQDVVIMPQRRAPSSTELTQSLEDHGIPQCRYQQPFYSDSNDVPESTMDIGGRLLKVHSNQLCTPDVPLRRRLTEAGSEIEGPSPINTAGYKVPQLNIQDAKANHEVQHLTLLSIELHVRTRKDRRPDPEFDPICAIFYHAQTDSPCPEGNNKVTGIICVDKESAELSRNPGSLSESAESSTDNSLRGKSTLGASACGTGQRQKRPLLIRSGVTQYHVHYIEEEKDIFQAFLFLVRKWDPDVLIGYEIQMLSWGYLIQRALVFDLDLGKLLSRVTGSSSESNVDAEKDTWGAAHTSELKIGGRIILNVWRLMRHEAALNIYTFENVAFHVLHERIPLFTFRSLSDWWDHKTDLHRWRTVQHYVTRCHGNIRLLDQVDFIGRTSELARLFGILFFSVISRGSQFRVESMMLRISKPLKYVAISPSVQQRNSMNAPEVIALVLEPESRFYSNPVLVLDFQSLYPSMIIAYNYCYSTCLGRVSCLEDLGEFKFGASTLSLPPMLLKKLEDDIHISPNGVAFVKSNVRLGVLPKMLEDILNTRIMVKNSMKKWKNKKSVCRMLDARQLGLKLIANVTYGYTAAHFSGRMPCVEIGDSIVRKARETLEHAIQVVNNTRKWGAKVVYGDTDSTRHTHPLANQSAPCLCYWMEFPKMKLSKFGKEITETITAMNPKPVRLKFEKVYLPCVLQTKKRYVGYMYETPDQKEPVFDAKGIETVRRDTCPAVAKILEKSLRLIFETKDVSLVKRYVQRQFRKVMEGRISLHDLTFAKEYRGMSSYKPAACVPALELARFADVPRITRVRVQPFTVSDTRKICYQCCGSRDTKLCCVSLDCPVFHKLVKATRDLDPSQYLRQLVADLLI
ncbi:hypothetical protein QZH41_012654 [Actinostola sp. cb2023]|nr:hypothetical protein QZH41_012654 [Actinostola sp. cb2023]